MIEIDGAHYYKNPVHQKEDGTWCFWDEVWAYEIGSYSSEEEAIKALEKYASEL